MVVDILISNHLDSDISNMSRDMFTVELEMLLKKSLQCENQHDTYHQNNCYFTERSLTLYLLMF